MVDHLGYLVGLLKIWQKSNFLGIECNHFNKKQANIQIVNISVHLNACPYNSYVISFLFGGHFLPKRDDIGI